MIRQHGALIARDQGPSGGPSSNLRFWDLVAEEVLNLGEADRDGGGGGEAGNDGVGEEGDEDAEVEEACRDLEDADEEGRQEGEPRILVGAQVGLQLPVRLH